MSLHMQAPSLLSLHTKSLSPKYVRGLTINRRWLKRPVSNISSSQASGTCGCKALADSSTQLLRPLLIDNYDSYTYNLYQIISEVYGVPPLVLHNDAVCIGGVQDMLAAGHVHHIILSPGPGSPDVPQDIGVCMDVLRQCPSVPVLGVCLGHQALALAAGGRVLRSPEPVHGRLSTLSHTGHPLFKDCPSGPDAGFNVVRYHSLIVDASSLPSDLQPLAWSCGATSPVALQQQVDLHTALAPDWQQHLEQQRHRLAQQQQQQQQQQKQQQQQEPTQQLLMALAHKHRPHYGVQFHPESIASQYGIQVLTNFRDLAYAASGVTLPQQLQASGLKGRGPPGRALTPTPWPVQQQQQPPTQQQQQPQQAQQQPQLWPAAGLSGSQLQLSWRKLPGVLACVGGTQGLFEVLVGPQPDTFWLDSASAPDRSRFSYMGSSSGPLWSRVTYKLPHPQQQQQQQQPGILQVTSNNPQQPQQQQQQSCATQQLSIWDYLQSQLQALQLSPSVSAAAAVELPFDFWGGFVGYLGYELKAECGGANAHTAPGPDAAWQFADRVIVADHREGDVYLLALHDAAAAAADTASGWLQATAAAVQGMSIAAAAAVSGSTGRQQQQRGMPVFAAAAVQEAPVRASAAAADVKQPRSSVLQQQLAAAVGDCRSPPPQQQQQQQQPRGVSLRHSRSAYLSNIAACKEALVAGESYELCLTTAFEVQQPPDPWTYYTTLRAHNPAPYAAWLSFGASSNSTSSSSNSSSSSSSSGAAASPPVVVCCSSPERFLQGGRGGLLEAKPIKGTARRSADPAADASAAAGLLVSEKERAENLMIVDLLRNDLGKVCVPGSVHVPGLLQLESYASVHQLVSTVRGLRAEGTGCVEAIRAAFPGGSMTGSPKIRSMAILDDLEGCARGVYSGALGYLSVNDTFDLNIVIRSAVFVGEQDGAGESCVADTASSSSSSAGGAGAGMRMSVGAGGAIVVQSDPPAEFAEMQLKAERLLQTAVLAQQQQHQQ